MLLHELDNYIASLLETGRFRDYCPNGVQVQGRPDIRRVASAVTASQHVLEAATVWGADAILVHHGYFWRNEDARIAGVKKRRIAHLLQHDISLLAYHLPLDAHDELGNNAQLGKALGFFELGRFGEQDIAFHGELGQAQTLGELVQHIAQHLQRVPQVIGNPQRNITRIAWCSGAAQGYFEAAIALGADAYLTGEISEQNVHMAEETGVAFIAAGHHATERFGIRALGEHVAERFNIEHRFFDQDVPV
ncbi:MAG TPA: Nif3-like dinuclear metal center hexameric protein [Gallionellaceae bacterium]